MRDVPLIDFIDLKAQYRELKQSINERIQIVLDHGRYIMGPEVGELEGRLAAFVGGGHCITVASGTDALLIALMALGVKGGDEVITTPFTFAATAEVIALLGATPVFIDVEPDTCNIDPRLIEAAITKRTRAILPVSLYGQPPDMTEINAIATHHGLAVIDDAAQSFGATYKGKRSGALSLVSCTSFFPSKPLGCYGDGGAIFTTDDVLALAMREIRVHGQQRRYYHTRVGVGGRMDTIQCAIVLAKLKRFDWELKRRAEVGKRYIELLSVSNSISTPVVRSDRTSAWAQFTVQVANRDAVAKALGDNCIPTAIHYPIPLHLQPAYKDLCRISGSLSAAEDVARRVLSLPMHPYLSDATQDLIVESLVAATA
jgi:UDP-2-acetamido-2-deoxy-ribo-hexuluronate aminotransferase